MTASTVDETVHSANGKDVVPGTAVALMALGMLLLQVTWVLAVPPFRGIDEFDHAYRAAAVARGSWAPTPTEATRGTGAWMDVPSDIVRAARPQCQALPYTKDADCVGHSHGPTTRIASGAGRYFPVFYAIIGTAARPFHGHAALYAMRLTTVALAWLLFCAALTATRRWARSRWPFVAVAVASTPMLLYSSSIVASNGVEMMAGLLLWTAVLGMISGSPGTTDRSSVVLAALAGAVLVTTRALGPFWCVATVLTAILATGAAREHVRALGRRRDVWCASAVVLACTVVSVVWILRMRTLDIGQRIEHPISWAERLRLLAVDLVLWLFQSIAAFPFRDQPAPMPVYACYLLIFVALLLFGLRAAGRPLQRAIVAAIVLTSAFPLALGLNPHGNPSVWQGRYTLPYAVGTALLLGLALDRAGRRLSPQLAAVGGTLFVIAQVIGPVHVLRISDRHPLADYASFPHPWPAGLAAAATLGAVALWAGATAIPARRARP